MSPLPPAALRAAELIRREVPRPTRWPDRAFPARWFVPDWGCKAPDGGAWCCPLGMLPESPIPVPFHEPVPGLDAQAVSSFAVWWDTQEDWRAAVEAVWGPA